MAEPEKKPEYSVEKIVSFLDSSCGWTVSYAIAKPDYKRPSVDRGKESFESERAAYEFVMEQLSEHGIMEDYVKDKVSIKGSDGKHWDNWASEEVVRHTLESAKALTAMANAGRFEAIVFSDGYMDEPSFKFEVARSPGVFSVAYVDVEGEMCLDTTEDTERIKPLLEGVLDGDPTQLKWTWTGAEKDVWDSQMESSSDEGSVASDECQD